MVVTVKFYYKLKKYCQSEDGEILLNVKKGTTIKEILEHQKIPLKEVPIISVNSKIVTIEEEVKDGDILKLFPIVSGG